MSNKTTIDTLVEDLRPAPKALNLTSFIIYYTLFSTIVLGLINLILPTRADLAVKIATPHFIIETVLWFVVAITTSYASYRSTLPGVNKSFALNTTIYTTMIVLTGFILYRLFTENHHPTLAEELQLWRGWCGPIIYISALCLSTTLIPILRNGLSSNNTNTSIMLALGTGAMGSMSTQFICAHEGPIHIFFWHYGPILVLGLSFIGLKRKILKDK